MFSHLAVIILAMGLSGFVLLSLVEDYFLQAAEDSLLAQARITAQALVAETTAAPLPTVESQAPAYNAVQQQQLSNLYIQADDVPGLADASFQLGTQLNTRIRVLNPQGAVLVDSWQADVGRNLAGSRLVEQAVSGQHASRTDEADDRMHLALPVQVDEQLIGIVYLSQPLDDITAVLGDLREQWLLATGVGLVLSGLVGLGLAGAMARPLRRLTAAVGGIAQGDFEQAVPVRSRDEMGRLARAFNDMAARLRAADRMQTDFVANVSHELRTPLTAIKGTVETLRDGAAGDPGVRDSFLATIERETDRLIRLVQDLLLLSRVDAEALTLRRAAVDVRVLVEAALSRLAFRTGAHLVQIEAVDGVPPAWADSDRVTQVLVNLLDNADKYSPTGSPITVRVAEQADHMVLLQVQDNGFGIASDELARIGQRFYRADKARAWGQGGSGLGLAIAESLVKAHGGRLWLESQEGAGTIASFTLPCA